MLNPTSRISGIVFPAVPHPSAATLLSVLFQLEQSQWRSEDELHDLQMTQLGHLVRHAFNTVPYYRARLDEAGLDPDSTRLSDGWRAMPLLMRQDLQASPEAVQSSTIPNSHGRVLTLSTSGSTGVPVLVRGTDVTQLFWNALTLRDHVWHRRDFRHAFAAIRYARSGLGTYPEGYQANNWGSATDAVVATGPAYLLNIQSTVDEQAEWLGRVNPQYVLSYPSVLRALAQHFRTRPPSLSRLCEIRTFGEILEPACRMACEDVFRVKVVDFYSAQETGYIALQCPEANHYHIQSESVLVEVLDAQGRPCEPGDVGRVVVTSLHNFSTPLLRYDIGDFAEVGEKCACGRSLPVLKRILGRQRNLITLPNGQRRWPAFGEGDRPDELPPVRQFQVVQKSLEQIEVKIVRDAPFTADEERIVRCYVQQTLGYPFEVRLNCVSEIARHPTGKFEDFISLIG